MSIFEYDEELHMRLEREEGIQTGIRRGKYLKLISQVQRKKAQNCSVEQIADDLGEEKELINEIYDVLEVNPGADTDKIYELWEQNAL